MAQHNDLGFKGEAIAKQYLEQLGYEILDENWHYNKAEIDIIAFDVDQLVFVEVKARSSTDFGEPEDFVDDAKQHHLERASAAYIEQVDWNGEIRFDIIAINFIKHREPVIKHIKDAFFPA